jgi:predicted DNA-binding protein
MPREKGKQVQVSFYLAPETLEQVKALSDRTRVPQAAYFREAIEDLLKKYEETKKGKKS